MKYLGFSNWLRSLSNIHLKCPPVSSWLHCSFLFSTEYYFIVWTCLHLSPNLPKGTLVASQSWQLRIKLLSTPLIEVLCVDINFQLICVECQGARLLDCMVRAGFIFKETCFPIVFQSDCTISHSHHKWMRLPVSSQPCQYWVLSLFGLGPC